MILSSFLYSFRRLFLDCYCFENIVDLHELRSVFNYRSQLKFERKEKCTSMEHLITMKSLDDT